jgi:hypothetical protein
MVWLKVLTCVRTTNMGTHFCVWYCFLGCTKSHFYNTTLRRVQHWGCHNIVNIESLRSDHIYCRDFTELIYWCNGSIINTELKHTSTVVILSSHPKRVSISSLLHRWGYTSTRLFHLPRIASYSSRSIEEDVQVASGRQDVQGVYGWRTVWLWETFQSIFFSLFVHSCLCTRVGDCDNVYTYTVTNVRLRRNK